MVYRQGQLDGLCGVYSIINAAKTLYPRTKGTTWQQVYQELIEFNFNNKGSLDFLIDGIVTPDISKSLRNIICPKLDIQYRKPFHRKSEVPLKILWKSLYMMLNDVDKRTAILCIEGHTYGHWTTVKSISHKRLTLSDSSGYKHINRHLCTTVEVSKDHPILIYPTTVFILERRST